jgi:hypothetical protein
MWKAMQGNIEDVSTRAFEPSRHAAQFVMLLKQKHTPPRPRQNVGRSHPSESTPDHNHVILGLNSLQKIFGHLQPLLNQRAVSKRSELENTWQERQWCRATPNTMLNRSVELKKGTKQNPDT